MIYSEGRTIATIAIFIYIRNNSEPNINISSLSFELISFEPQNEQDDEAVEYYRGDYPTDPFADPQYVDL